MQPAPLLDHHRHRFREFLDRCRQFAGPLGLTCPHLGEQGQQLLSVGLEYLPGGRCIPSGMQLGLWRRRVPRRTLAFAHSALSPDQAKRAVPEARPGQKKNGEA